MRWVCMCVRVCVGSLTDFRLWMGLNNSKQTDNNSLHPRTNSHTHTHICTYLQLCFRGFYVNICASGGLPSKSMSVNCCGLRRIIIFAIVRQWLTNVHPHYNTHKHTHTRMHMYEFALKRSRRASRRATPPPSHAPISKSSLRFVSLCCICRALHMLRDYVMARHLISNRRRIITKSAQQKHQRLEM